MAVYLTQTNVLSTDTAIKSTVTVIPQFRDVQVSRTQSKGHVSASTQPEAAQLDVHHRGSGAFEIRREVVDAAPHLAVCEDKNMAFGILSFELAHHTVEIMYGPV